MQAHALALQLLQIALDRGQHGLVAELLRFMTPPEDPSPDDSGHAHSLQNGAAAHPPSSLYSAGDGAGLGAPGAGMLDAARRQSLREGCGVLIGRRNPAGNDSKGGKGLMSYIPGYSWLLGGGGANGGGRRSGHQGYALSEDAYKTVARHARGLLASGCLADLAALSRSMEFTHHGGLAGIMSEDLAEAPGQRAAGVRGTGRASSSGAGKAGAQQQQQQEAPVTVEQLYDALCIAMRELPVWEGALVESNAMHFRALCQQLPGVQHWCIVMAVLLVDLPAIGAFKAQHPDTWRDFCAKVSLEDRLDFVQDVLAAV